MATKKIMGGMDYLISEVNKIDPEKEREERAKKTAEGRAIAARCERVKEKVFKLERNNRDKLYVFYSGPGWHKMGGNSALFYAKLYGPRLGYNVNIKPDKDRYSKFVNGVCSIRDMKMLKQGFEKMGIKVIAEDDDVTVFDLGQKITDTEMEAIYQEAEERKKQINKILEVDEDNTHPQIAQAQRRISQWLHGKMTKASQADRDYILTSLSARALKATVDAYEMASYRIDPATALKEIYSLDCRVKRYIYVLMEQGLFTQKEVLNMELILDDTCTAIRAELKKMGEKTVEEIFKERAGK